jgi:hypothetical protein
MPSVIPNRGGLPLFQDTNARRQEKAGPLLLRGHHDLQRASQGRLARWGSGRRAVHWRGLWTSRFSVRAAHGIRSGRTRAGIAKEKLAKDLFWARTVYVDTAVEDGSAVCSVWVAP